jgi:salicylate 5-hydroxylase small subunit
MLTPEDRAAITDLYLRYVETVDDGPLERWPEHFVDDCSYRIIGRENVERDLPLAILRCDSKGMLLDRVAAFRDTAFYVERRLRHVLGPVDIRSDAEPVSARANFAVYESLPRSPSTLLCVGTYDDVLVRAGGGWRFRQRHCIYDGDLLTSSIVRPL